VTEPGARPDHRPFTVVSCCVSLDGCLDDASDRRLVLSNAADLDEVDALRAACDAILVGAGTVRADDPRLLVRDSLRRAERARRGLPESPLKVTVTERGRLEAHARFFATGTAGRLVYCPAAAAPGLRSRLGGAASVVGLDPVSDPGARTGVAMSAIVGDLHSRGVRRLLVEGGASVLTQFLDEGLVDELRLAVAPVLVGDARAPRLLGPPGCGGPFARARLVDVRHVGDVVVVWYAFTAGSGGRTRLRRVAVGSEEG
jgi:5-amino-6-(5-phosphoribosylamino)uracil reductase